MPMSDRLLTAPEALVALVAQLRAEGKTIVTTNGSFDLLHRGHLGLLSVARRAGDVVIVGLNSDVSVRAYKGPLRPIVPESDRAALLLALETVDYVYLFDEPECLEFVRLARPDVHVNDAAYGPLCIEAELVAQGGGRLLLVHKAPGASSTDIVRRVVEASGQTWKTS